MKKQAGLTIYYCGNGKGKTTAALGLALRAIGYGKKVLVVQFIKGDYLSGEDLSTRQIKNITIEKKGLGFVKKTDKREKHLEAARDALGRLQEALRGSYDVIVADEILNAVQAKLINKNDVINLIKEKRPYQSLVLTGRPSYKRIIDQCDLATRMTKLKHSYDKGVLAVKSIDY